MALLTTADLRSEEFYRTLIIPALEKSSAALQHLTRIDTSSTSVHLPRVDPASVGWVAEGAALPDAGIAADLLEIVPRKVAAFCDLTNESVNDANSAGIAGQALALALAVKLDAALFVSGGVNAPDALADADAIDIDADPTSGVDPYTDAVAAMENDGATPSIIFVNPLDWGALGKVKATSGGALPVLSAITGPGAVVARSLLGLPVVASAGCPAGTAYVIDGSRASVVVRQDGTVQADGSVGFKSDVTTLRVVGRFGFAFPYPEAIARITEAP